MVEDPRILSDIAERRNRHISYLDSAVKMIPDLNDRKGFLELGERLKDYNGYVLFNASQKEDYNRVIEVYDRLRVEAQKGYNLLKKKILTPNIDISFVTGSNYAHTVHTFREACQRDSNSRQPLWTCEDGTQIPRAFTISELLILKVEDFETTMDKEGRERSLADRLRTFNVYNDTGSANVSGNNGDFKLVQLYKPFIEIPQNPGLNSTGGLPADFADVDAPVIRRGNGVYGQWLTKEQIMNSEFWRNVAGDTDEGVKVLDAYSNIVLANIGNNSTAMAVHLSSGRNEARALYVYDLSVRSIANGDSSLLSSARFPRVSQAPQR